MIHTCVGTHPKMKTTNMKDKCSCCANRRHLKVTFSFLRKQILPVARHTCENHDN